MEYKQGVHKMDTHILEYDESIGNWNSKKFQKPPPPKTELIIRQCYEYKNALEKTKKILQENYHEFIRILHEQFILSINEIDSLEKSVKKWIAAAKFDNSSEISMDEIQELARVSPLAISNNTAEAFKNVLEQLRPSFDYNTINKLESHYNRILEQLERNKKKEIIQEKKEDDYIVEKKKAKKNRRPENEDPDVNEFDILIVMRYTKASKFEAINALKVTHGNFSDAIIYITTGKIP